MERQTKLLIILGAVSAIAIYYYRNEIQSGIEAGIDTVTDNFKSATDFIIGKFEGGFQKIYGDSGNWTSGKVGVGELKGTKYGISAAAYPNIDIANLTYEQAVALYKRDYWIPKYDEIEDAVIATKAFDMSINMGTYTSTKIIQRAVGVNDDGIFGNGTLNAVNSIDAPLLLMSIQQQQRSYYDAIIARDANKAQFRNTWYARAAWPKTYQAGLIALGLA